MSNQSPNVLSEEFIRSVAGVMNSVPGPISIGAEEFLVLIMEYSSEQHIKEAAFKVLDDSNLEICPDTIRKMQEFVSSKTLR